MAADLLGKTHFSRSYTQAQNYVNNGNLPGKSAAATLLPPPLFEGKDLSFVDKQTALHCRPIVGKTLNRINIMFQPNSTFSANFQLIKYLT